jgi:ribose transport system substrate-binding protein
VAQAVAALDGQPVQQKVQTGFTIITQQNVDGDARDALYKSNC